MYPLNKDDELAYQISPDPTPNYTTEQDPIMGRHSSVESSNPSTKTRRKRQQELVDVLPGNDKDENTAQQKTIHKEIERKRRQEMSRLHASLRSLLPLEYIKGRRSISVHIEQSTNYIKQLEKNIEELSFKRDELRQMSDSAVLSTASASSNALFPCNYSVTVSPCSGGVEILITSGFREEVFPLSRVLEVLLQEGFEVDSCVSTIVNDRLLHKIKSEVSSPTCTDLSVLQQKLTDLVGFESNFK